MKYRLQIILLCLLIGIFSGVGYSQDAKTITSHEAKDHLGDTVWVSGKVSQATLSYNAKGIPAYLNFGEAYPNHHFTVVIWTESYPTFNESKVKSYEGKEVRVLGVVKEYRGKPQIVFNNESLIELVSND